MKTAIRVIMNMGTLTHPTNWESERDQVIIGARSTEKRAALNPAPVRENCIFLMDYLREVTE